MNFIHTHSTDYKKIKKLGEGSFGEVFLVNNIKSGKHYVSKDIQIEGMSEDVIIQMFREAKILEALDHPNIIKLYEFYKTKSKKLVLILELAEGGDLSELIKKQNTPKEEKPNKKQSKTLKKDYFPEKTIISKIKRMDNPIAPLTKTLPRQ